MKKGSFILPILRQAFPRRRSRPLGAAVALYHQADKGAQSLEQAFQSPPSNDEQVLFHLPVTRARLRQVVLGPVLLCHSSFRGVIAFFADLLDQPIALGTAHNIVQEAVVEARRINTAQELSGVRAGSHDELFQGRKPVLAGIDLDSLYCYLLAWSEVGCDGDVFHGLQTLTRLATTLEKRAYAAPQLTKLIRERLRPRKATHQNQRKSILI